MNVQNKIRQLQLICVDILFMFDEICKAYNLQYYLAFGTLLGAVRHHGFIPWDDDIDLFMPREDLERFVGLCPKVIKPPYRINHYKFDNFTSNSYNLRIGTEKASIKRVVGGQAKEFDVFISIFPIDDAPSSKIGRCLHNIRISYAYSRLRLIRSANNGYGNVKRSKLEYLAVALNKYMPIFKGKSERNAANKVNKVLMKCQAPKSAFCTVYTYGLYKPFFRKEWFMNPVMVEYEGKMLPCPSNYDMVLKQCYHNYMELPPVEKRIPRHSIDVTFK